MIPCYDIIIGLHYTLLFSILCASYTLGIYYMPPPRHGKETLHPPPFSPWRPRKGEFVWVHTRREIATWVVTDITCIVGTSSFSVKKPDQSNICWRGSAIYTPTLSHAASAAALSMPSAAALAARRGCDVEEGRAALAVVCTRDGGGRGVPETCSLRITIFL